MRRGQGNRSSPPTAATTDIRRTIYSSIKSHWTVLRVVSMIRKFHLNLITYSSLFVQY